MFLAPSLNVDFCFEFNHKIIDVMSPDSCLDPTRLLLHLEFCQQLLPEYRGCPVNSFELKYLMVKDEAIDCSFVQCEFRPKIISFLSM